MDFRLTPEQLERAELLHQEVVAEISAGYDPPRPTAKIKHEWARHYFPHAFSRPFTSYQEEFWDWGWGIEPDSIVRPRVECEPRGVGKSTNAEAWVASLIARKKRKMVGYVSLDEDKAGKHFDAIRTLLETETLLRDYPHCRPKVQKLRNTAAQWSRDALVTESDAMIVPLSLLGSSRGWKSPTNERFDVIVLDDIDKLGMSVQVIRKMLELLKSEILAAGTAKTVVLMPQNLIHRDSICSMIFDGRADILANRIFCGPYPLLKLKPEYQAEKVVIPGDTTGATEWVITAGEPFDEAVPIEYAQSLLTMLGKGTFDRECQQDVHKVEDDKDFREWDERYHVITYSEFRAYFEQFHLPVWNLTRNKPQIPHDWNVGLGLDWGCLTMDTEILTPAGWKTHDQLVEGEMVAAYDWENDQKITWSPLLKKVHKHDQPLVEMRRKSFRFVCTPDHAWIVRRPKRGKMTRDTYRRQNLDTIPHGHADFVLAAEMDAPGVIDCKPEVAAVLGWLVTDGWTQARPGKRPAGLICQKNYPELVIRTLEASGLQWNEVKATKNGTRLFYLGVDAYASLVEQTGYDGKETLPTIAANLSPEARRAMLDAMLAAEGTKNGTDRHVIFCQKRGPVMDAFQILATLCGVRLGVERDHESQHGGPSRRISLLRHRHMNYPEIAPLEGLHDVWCPSVKEGAVVARQRGQVTITGNTTLAHPAACVAFARPPQRAPLNDCYFGFMEAVLPKYPHTAGEDPELVSPGRVASAIQEALREWGVNWSQVKQALMSHEASAARNTFVLDLPKELQVFFNKWKAKRGSGVPQVQAMLEIDHEQHHPFRRSLVGRPRFYLVVPDDQGGIMVDAVLGGEYVGAARDRHGFARLRYEIPLYNHRNAGEKKIDDDAVDGLLGLANTFMVVSEQLTTPERRERALPAHLQDVERILMEEPETAERVMLARTVEFGKMDEKDAKRRQTMAKFRPQVPKVGIRRGR